MPEPRWMFFLVNDRQDRWWLYGDDRRQLFQKTDAEPLPSERRSERRLDARRLAWRLRSIFQTRRRVGGAMP